MTKLETQKNKADQNKLEPRLIQKDMAKAMRSLYAVATYGAQKYEAGSWKTVAAERYEDALYRHLSDIEMGEAHDKESGLPHLAHVAWNALALLQLLATDCDALNFQNFNTPPQDHKTR